MSTDYEIRIKGRNELGLAVKQAEQQLRGLAKSGELFAKVFRGGAIVGAALAFERLAQNAEAAAIAIGDDGTAKALHQLNREIDTLKSKGLNVIGKVLGNVYTAFRGDELAKIREQIEFLQRMQGRSFLAAGYGKVGTGFFTAAEGAAKLRELQAQERALVQFEESFTTRRAGAVSRGGGSGVLTTYSSAFDAPATKAPSGKAGPQFSAEFEAYLAQLERAGEGQRHLAETADEADKAIRENFAEGLEIAEQQLEQLGTTAQSVSGEMTVFAEQAARNLQTSFAQFLFDPFKEGLDGMLAGFVNTIRQMIAEAAAAQILKSVFSWASGVTSGGVSSFFGSLAGARASGGPVMGGSAYLVGESGPEVFVPSSSGMVVANGSGGVSLNYTIDARGADAERIMAILPGLLKQTSDQTVQRIRDLNGRGRL
jgi:hypothetical protein